MDDELFNLHVVNAPVNYDEGKTTGAYAGLGSFGLYWNQEVFRNIFVTEGADGQKTETPPLPCARASP